MPSWTTLRPVLLDHEENHQVGFVSDLRERDGWVEATFVLEMDRALSPAVAEYVRVGTPVSVGAKSLVTDDDAAALGIGLKRQLAAILEEVSILGPDLVPAYRGAKVIGITERESRSLGCTVSARSASERRPD